MKVNNLCCGLRWELDLEKRLKDERCLEMYGYKVYSQNDEDGIIEHIFSKIGVESKYFIEIGIQNGLESNGHLLLLSGWSGLWIEGNNESVNEAKVLFKNCNDRIQILNKFVTCENINEIIEQNIIKDKTVDLLSIDIDGNDYYIWEKISCISPRVVIMEYNATVPPTIEYCQKYDSQKYWDGTDCFGASLLSLQKLGRKKGYKLVGTCLAGVNAFFVRDDLANDDNFILSDAESLYNPPRYWIQYQTGHPNRYYIGEK